MATFYIEDKSGGKVVATGEIQSDGTAIFSQSTLSPSDLEAAKAQIELDIQEGFSGGVLPVPFLEWFELVAPD